MSATLSTDRRIGGRGFWLGLLGYALPTFALGYLWHLILFASAYRDLAIYREDVIIPFGLLSMLVQGAAFSWLYPRIFPERRGNVLGAGLSYGLALASVSWSFTTLAVAAKSVMASVPTYLMLETGFTLVQFAIAGPLIAWAHRN